MSHSRKMTRPHFAKKGGQQKNDKESRIRSKLFVYYHLTRSFTVISDYQANIEILKLDAIGFFAKLIKKVQMYAKHLHQGIDTYMY